MGSPNRPNWVNWVYVFGRGLASRFFRLDLVKHAIYADPTLLQALSGIDNSGYNQLKEMAASKKHAIQVWFPPWTRPFSTKYSAPAQTSSISTIPQLPFNFIRYALP